MQGPTIGAHDQQFQEMRAQIQHHIEMLPQLATQHATRV